MSHLGLRVGKGVTAGEGVLRSLGIFYVTLGRQKQLQEVPLGRWETRKGSGNGGVADKGILEAWSPPIGWIGEA